MSELFDRWRKEILRTMYDELKPLGFKKHATTFVLLQNDVWSVINLQSSQFNEGREMRLMVNVGLCYGKNSTAIGNPKTGPKSNECHWFGRVGKGWSVTSDADALVSGRAIARRSLEVAQRARLALPTPQAAWDSLAISHVTSDPDGIVSSGVLISEFGFDIATLPTRQSMRSRSCWANHENPKGDGSRRPDRLRTCRRAAARPPVQ